MNLSFQVAGYDKQTELLTVAHPVPSSLSDAAKKLAHVGAEDDGQGAYPLEASAALKLGLQMDAKLNPELYDWFLEPAQND